MSKTPVQKDGVSSRAGRESLIRRYVFKIGKKCREWFVPLQEPEATGLRQAGVDLMGLSVLRPPYIMSRPHHEFHVLQLPLHGEMRLTLPGGIKQIRAGELWLIPADTLSRYELLKGEVKMTWFHLNRSAVPDSLHKGEATLLSKGSPVIQRMYFYMESLREEGHRTEPGSLELRHKFYELMEIELRRIIRSGGGITQAGLRIHRIWDEIEQNPGYEWDVPQMARKAGLSPSRFHALCLEYFGMTPHEKITRIRMNRAIGLLLSSEQKIEAVSLESGYTTPFAFSKAFKKITGLSPKSFREKSYNRPAQSMDIQKTKGMDCHVEDSSQ